MTTVFLSHNSADKAYARRLAGTLQLAGAQVWFDEWHVRPGDSIPGAINAALADFDVFVLLWSANAAASRWVANEVESAIASRIANPSRRIVPVVLDAAPLPALVAHLRFVDGNDTPAVVAQQLLGFNTERELMKAVQNALLESGFDVTMIWGVGPMICCPRCGASPNQFEGWEYVDEKRDDLYRGVRCKECGWEEGGEV